MELPLELLERPDLRRALAHGDWSTVLTIIVRETGASQTSLAAVTGLSQPHISRLLRGMATEPSIRTVQALCDGLGIPRSLAGLADKEDATNRRQVLGGALGASGLVLAGERGPAVQHAPDEQLLMMLSASYRRLEQHLASRMLIGPAVAHLTLVRQIQQRRAGRAGRRLATVISETAGLAAWLYVDLDDRANARRHYQLAIAQARDSGHPLLPAYMIASLGHFAVSSGDAAQGLHLVAQARASLPRSAPVVASVWLDSIEAVALAERHDQRALGLLDVAEGRLDRVADDDPVWPWLFRFDRPKLAGYRAAVEAKLQRWRAAAGSFRTAAGATQSPKQHAVLQVEQARVLAARDQSERACALAVDAFDTGRAYGSERILRAVAAFRAALGGRGGAAVAELDDRLNTVYRDEL